MGSSRPSSRTVICPGNHLAVSVRPFRPQEACPDSALAWMSKLLFCSHLRLLHPCLRVHHRLHRQLVLPSRGQDGLSPTPNLSHAIRVAGIVVHRNLPMPDLARHPRGKNTDVVVLQARPVELRPPRQVPLGLVAQPRDPRIASAKKQFFFNFLLF